jgi:hypothetical protein
VRKGQADILSDHSFIEAAIKKNDNIKRLHPEETAIH